MSDEIILIIDDSREMVEHLAGQMLPAFGYKTLHTNNGKEGLALMRQKRPDLVMLDLNLPQMTGLDVLQAMAAETIDIPVILMTGYGSEKSAIEAFRLGIKDYLVKPFTVEEVLNTIDRALVESRARLDADRLVLTLRSAEHDARRQASDAHQLIAISKELLLLRRQDQLLDRSLTHLQQIIGGERCVIWLHQADTQSLHAYERGGINLRAPGMDVSEDDHLVWRVFEQGSTLRQTSFVGKGMELLAGVFARAVLLTPLRVNEKIIGVLGLSNHRAPEAFSDREQVLFETLADYIAIALANTRPAYAYDQVIPSPPAEAVSLQTLLNIAHDLRAPLHSIEGFAETLLAAGSLDQQQALSVNYIVESAQRLVRLVDSLLNAGRLDAGFTEAQETVDVREIVKHVVQDLQGTARSKEIDLQISSTPTPLLVVGNPDQLAQAVRNLVDNAIKYSPVSSPVSIDIRQDEQRVFVEVKDEGAGIDRHDLPFIFERFFRAKMSAGTEGTGLGLASVRAIAVAHGGDVAVASEQGQGSSFKLILPSAGRL